MEFRNFQPRSLANLYNVMIRSLLSAHKCHCIDLHHVTGLRIAGLGRWEACRGRGIRGGGRGDEARDDEFVNEDLRFRIFLERVAETFEDFLGDFIGILSTIVRTISDGKIHNAPHPVDIRFSFLGSKVIVNFHFHSARFNGSRNLLFKQLTNQPGNP
jgi:hypothetical protein